MKLTKLFQAAPAVLFLSIFLVFPVLKLGYEAVTAVSDESFSASGWIWPHLGHVLYKTTLLSFFVTLTCLFLSIPVALTLLKVKGTLKLIMIFVIIVPIWTNILVRTLGLRVLLDSNGILATLINSLLGSGIPKLMFNEVGVVIGLANWLLPLMIFNSYTAIRDVDPELLLVASTLGANRVTKLKRVVLPIIFPNLLLGFLLVYVLSFSSFITPKLLGGIGDITIARLVGELFISREIGAAGLVSFVSMLLALLGTAFSVAIVKRLIKI